MELMGFWQEIAAGLIIAAVVGVVTLIWNYFQNKRASKQIDAPTATGAIEPPPVSPIANVQVPTIALPSPDPLPAKPLAPFRQPPKIKLVGRAAEVKALRKKLEQERGGMVVLRGLAGVGKSTLAADAYWNYATDLCPDGVYWLDVRDGDMGVALRSLLVHHFVESSSALPNDAASLAAVWQAKIRGKSVFVVLDNAESLGATLKEQLEWVRVPPPGITLVTSRNTVSIANDIEIKRFTEQDALRYLQEKLRWSFAQRKAEEADAKALIEFLGGLVLGLKLTVDLMLVRGQNCAAALAHLKQASLMNLSAIEVGERTLLAAFILSYTPLPDDAKTVFHLVGICAKTGTTLEAITAMLGWQPQQVQALLDTLSHYSLAEMRNGRIELHPALHEFAWHQVQQGDDYETLEQSHVRYYGLTIGGLLEQAISTQSDIQIALVAIDNEIDNVRLAQVRALTPSFKDSRLAVDVMYALRQFWRIRDVPELETWLFTTLVLAKKTGQTSQQAYTHLMLGNVQWSLDNYDSALASYTEALTIFKSASDRLGQANTQKAIGDVQKFRDDYASALASYTEALAIFTSIGNRLGQASTQRAIGDMQASRKENAIALASYTEALAFFKSVGDSLGQANTLYAIGNVQAFSQENASALASYTEALSLYKIVGSKLGLANCHLKIAYLQNEESSFIEALTLYESIQAIYNLALCKYYYAEYLAKQKQVLKALQLYQDARTGWISINFTDGVRDIDKAMAELNAES